MPRNHVRITNRGTTPESTMIKAALLCIEGNMSERSAATKFNICHVSLNRYIKKFILQRDTGCVLSFGYRSHNKIFDEVQEKQLADYAKISADMYFGLNLKNIRKLAYEFSVKLNLTVPKSWEYNKQAGPDWAADFLKRNPSVSICLPKATGISRAIHFKSENVKYFVDKYESILLKYKLQAHDIYNMDKLGVTFIQKTGKIVASRDNKHTAIENGKNRTVNMCLAINATGNLIPPMYIFSNNLNMEGVEFLKYLKKFTKHVKPSVDKKVLILLDNHESHLCLPVIDFCRESGILLLSFPPHCFEKLQPLNRTVYRLFNQFLNKNMLAWIENNPGKRLRAYDVPLVSSRALVSAATPKNIINGFSISGIWPLNREVFTRDKLMQEVVADIDDMLVDNIDEEPKNYVIRKPKNCITEEPVNNIDITPHIKPEESVTRPIIDLSSSSGILSEHAKRYLKLALGDKKKRKIGSKRKKKSTIRTNTPKKLKIEDKTKNNTKRNRVFKNKKNKKSKS